VVGSARAASMVHPGPGYLVGALAAPRSWVAAAIVRRSTIPTQRGGGGRSGLERGLAARPGS